MRCPPKKSSITSFAIYLTAILSLLASGCDSDAYPPPQAAAEETHPSKSTSPAIETIINNVMPQIVWCNDHTFVAVDVSGKEIRMINVDTHKTRVLDAIKTNPSFLRYTPMACTLDEKWVYYDSPNIDESTLAANTLIEEEDGRPLGYYSGFNQYPGGWLFAHHVPTGKKYPVAGSNLPTGIEDNMWPSMLSADNRLMIAQGIQDEEYVAKKSLSPSPVKIVGLMSLARLLKSGDNTRKGKHSGDATDYDCTPPVWLDNIHIVIEPCADYFGSAINSLWVMEVTLDKNAKLSAINKREIKISGNAPLSVFVVLKKGGAMVLTDAYNGVGHDEKNPSQWSIKDKTFLLCDRNIKDTKECAQIPSVLIRSNGQKARLLDINEDGTRLYASPDACLTAVSSTGTQSDCFYKIEQILKFQRESGKKPHKHPNAFDKFTTVFYWRNFPASSKNNRFFIDYVEDMYHPDNGLPIRTRLTLVPIIKR